jgi:hypothetical protein
MPVCGNLYHHALEMFLKAGLSRKYSLAELKSKFVHKLFDTERIQGRLSFNRISTI